MTKVYNSRKENAARDTNNTKRRNKSCKIVKNCVQGVNFIIKHNEGSKITLSEKSTKKHIIDSLLMRFTVRT